MHRHVALELMDGTEEAFSPAEWCGCLGDLADMNRLLGGRRLTFAEINRITPPPTRILDVATGGADMPIALLDYLRKRGRPARCVAVDRSEVLLSLAAERAAGRTDLTLRHADALALPFADGEFDVATLNLALHHFEPDDAPRVLRELARVARTVIVNDLHRHWIAHAFAAIVLRALLRSRIARNDAPLSVRRAYTPAEAADLARRAGWSRVEVRTYFGYRFALVGGRG